VSALDDLGKQKRMREILCLPSNPSGLCSSGQFDSFAAKRWEETKLMGPPAAGGSARASDVLRRVCQNIHRAKRFVGESSASSVFAGQHPSSSLFILLSPESASTCGGEENAEKKGLMLFLWRKYRPGPPL